MRGGSSEGLTGTLNGYEPELTLLITPALLLLKHVKMSTSNSRLFFSIQLEIMY